MVAEVTTTPQAQELMLQAAPEDLEEVALNHQELPEDLEMLEVILPLKEIQEEMVVEAAVLTQAAEEAAAQQKAAPEEEVPDKLVLVEPEQQLVLQDHL